MTSTQALLLLLVSIAIIYGLMILLNFVFEQIENYHDAWREARAADPRDSGGEQGEEKVRSI